MPQFYKPYSKCLVEIHAVVSILWCKMCLNLHVCFGIHKGAESGISDDELACLSDVVYGVRLAAKIVDMPCAEMDTSAFIMV